MFERDEEYNIPQGDAVERRNESKHMIKFRDESKRQYKAVNKAGNKLRKMVEIRHGPE